MDPNINIWVTFFKSFKYNSMEKYKPFNKSCYNRHPYANQQTNQNPKITKPIPQILYKNKFLYKMDHRPSIECKNKILQGSVLPKLLGRGSDLRVCLLIQYSISPDVFSLSSHPCPLPNSLGLGYLVSWTCYLCDANELGGGTEASACVQCIMLTRSIGLIPKIQMFCTLHRPSSLKAEQKVSSSNHTSPFLPSFSSLIFLIQICKIRKPHSH